MKEHEKLRKMESALRTISAAMAIVKLFGRVDDDLVKEHEKLIRMVDEQRIRFYEAARNLPYEWTRQPSVAPPTSHLNQQSSTKEICHYDAD